MQIIVQPAAWVNFNLYKMKISNIVLTAMISAAFLLSTDANAQKVNAQISKSQKFKNKIKKAKQDSIDKVEATKVDKIHKYCPPCGMG